MGIFLKTLMATVPRASVLVWFVCGALTMCSFPAGAIDLSTLGQVQERAQATADVEAARRAVASSRKKTEVARQRLDAFLAKHFEPAGKGAISQSSPEFPAENANDQPATDSEAESLRIQLQDLKAERERLLATLTEAHPEVVDVDDRIADAESKFEAMLGAGSAEPPAPLDAPSTSTSSSSDLQRAQAEAAEFRLLFADWQACEKDLEKARDVETKAIEGLAALPVAAPLAEKPVELTPSTPTPHPPAAAVIIDDRVPSPQAPVATATPVAAPVASSAGSESLALAALAVALAISALAAVKLSRAASDPLFSSADDVAAALAVPVVGILTATLSGNRAGEPAALRRTVVVGLQILLAVTVFVAIAYLVQHLEDLTQFRANPITAIRGWIGI
jgi:hypothetical protein